MITFEFRNKKNNLFKVILYFILGLFIYIITKDYFILNKNVIVLIVSISSFIIVIMNTKKTQWVIHKIIIKDNIITIYYLKVTKKTYIINIENVTPIFYENKIEFYDKITKSFIGVIHKNTLIDDTNIKELHDLFISKKI